MRAPRCTATNRPGITATRCWSGWWHETPLAAPEARHGFAGAHPSVGGLGAIAGASARPSGPPARSIMTESHYRFPPASAYRVNRCLFALKSDAEFRARYVADAPSAMRELGLSDAEQAILHQFDRDDLVERGAHPYLVFMADLRLRMERGQTTVEYF